MGVITYGAAWWLLLLLVVEVMEVRFFLPCAGSWVKHGEPVGIHLLGVEASIQMEIFEEAANEENRSRFKAGEKRRNVRVKLDGTDLSMFEYLEREVSDEEGYAISEAVSKFCFEGPGGLKFHQEQGFASKFPLSSDGKKLEVMTKIGEKFAEGSSSTLTGNELKLQCFWIAEALDRFISGYNLQAAYGTVRSMPNKKFPPANEIMPPVHKVSGGKIQADKFPSNLPTTSPTSNPADERAKATLEEFQTLWLMEPEPSWCRFPEFHGTIAVHENDKIVVRVELSYAAAAADDSGARGDASSKQQKKKKMEESLLQTVLKVKQN